MTDDNLYETTHGRLITDGGTAAAQKGGMAGGPPTLEAAEEMQGAGPGFQMATAKTKARRAAQMGAKRMAAQAAAQHQRLRANAGQLRRDEYEQLDETIKTVARQNLVALDDLLSRNLVIDLDLGTLRWTWEDVDDTGDAEMDMAGTTGANEDVPDFDETGMPLPVVHKSFYFNRRKLEASRSRGEPLDTTMAAQSTRAVREKLEDVVFNGAPGIVQQGDTIYGYTNHPDRATPSGNATWDGATADNMIDDIMRTIEAIEDQNRGGADIAFYIARQNFQEIRAKSAGTDDKRGVLELVRNRLSAEDDFPGVTFKRADYLDDGEAVAVELTQDNVELAMVSDFQMVDWESNGGWTTHQKVLAGMFPVLKSDRNSNMGLAHLSGI